MQLRHLGGPGRNSSKQLFPVCVKLSINRKKIESEIGFPEKTGITEDHSHIQNKYQSH
jgi:hypothetical protein